MPTLELQGKQITYRAIIGRSKKYVYFKFRPDLTLEILLPQRRVDLDEIIRKKKDWILNKYDDLARSKKVFNDGQLLFKGKYLKIVIERAGNQEFKQPEIRKGEVIFYSNGETRLKDLIRQWYIKETSKYLKRALPTLAGRLSVQYGGVDVRELRKWGYCSRKGRLSFSWQLIALPKNLRDYVVLHELIHLTEFSHSNTFHKKLASVRPDYREREIELKHIVSF